MRTGKMHADFVGAAACCVSLTRDGQCTLVSTTDGSVRLLDKDNGEMLGHYTGHAQANEYKSVGASINRQSIEFRLESTTLASDTHILGGSEDGRVICWDLVSSNIAQVRRQSIKQ